MDKPATVQCTADALNKSCWVCDEVGAQGYRHYTGIIVGIVKHPTLGKFYQIRAKGVTETIHPSLVIICES